MPITQRQQKFLLDRLESIRASKPREWDPLVVPESDAVKAARKQLDQASKIISKYGKKVADLKKKRNAKLTADVIRVKQAILFGDQWAAIRLLNEFEKRTF